MTSRTLLLAALPLLLLPEPDLPAATAAPADSEAATLAFREDWAGARKQAQRESRGMVVEFETAWCPFCRAMERVTFKDPTVIEAARDLVLVKVDADSQKALAKRFEVGDGFPLFVFLDRDQEELFRLEGYHPPDSFRRALASVSDEDSELASAVRAARSNPSDARAQVAVGDGLYLVGAVGEASEAYRRALDIGLEGEARERAASRRAEHCREQGLWSEAEQLYRSLLEERGASERAPFWGLGLVKTYVGWGRTDKARQEAGRLAQQWPEHPAVTSAQALVAD